MANKFDTVLSAKSLRKNTDIIESTFSSFGLSVLSVGYQVNSDSVETLVEVSSGTSKLKMDVDIVVNIYDSDGDLVSSSTEYLDKDSFNGYDTVNIIDCNIGLGTTANKARIFVRAS